MRGRAGANVSAARALTEAYNQRDYETVAALVDERAQWLEVPTGRFLPSREAVVDGYRNWVRAFPDGRSEITNVIDGGSWVVVEFTVRGTNTGPFAGPDGDIPPTGKRIELPTCDVMHMEDGVLLGGRGYFDLDTIKRHLG